MQSLCASIQHQHNRIVEAATLAHRDPSEIRLLLASKKQPVGVISQAHQCGHVLFGENTAQELVAKVDLLPPLQWHFIGHLQTNKVKDVVPRAACIQSVDRVSLVLEIAKYCAKWERSIDVMIEVNTSGEASKHGVLPDEVNLVIDKVLENPLLRITGFMTIGAMDDSEIVVRKGFRMLRTIRDNFDAQHGTASGLSMGMSHDLPWAIAEGSTMVRVGTAVFGNRLKGG